MNKSAVVLLTAALMGGCAHKPSPVPEPVLVPVEVVVPIVNGCVPANMAAPPEYPDTDAALRSASGADVRYQLLYAGRKVRSARLAEIEPVIAGCPKATVK